MPPDIQAAFDVFQSIPRRALEEQQEIREIVLATEKMFHELTTHYLITEEFVQKLRSQFYRYIECLFIQHDVQVSTYHERETVLGYLSSQVSIIAVVAISPLEKTSPGDDYYEHGRFRGSRGRPK